MLCGKLTLFFKKNKCPFYATNRVEWAFFDGGPEEIRTLDLSDANRTLSQLSYRPNSNCLMIITRSFFNCNTFFIFLCKSFFVRKNENRQEVTVKYPSENRLSDTVYSVGQSRIEHYRNRTRQSPFDSAALMRLYISCIFLSISEIFPAHSSISSFIPSGSFDLSAL